MARSNWPTIGYGTEIMGDQNIGAGQRIEVPNGEFT